MGVRIQVFFILLIMMIGYSHSKPHIHGRYHGRHVQNRLMYKNNNVATTERSPENNNNIFEGNPNSPLMSDIDDDSDKFSFIELNNGLSYPKSDNEIPELCNGEKYCEKPQDSAKIDRILAKSRISYTHLLQTENNVDVVLENRFNEDPSPLCLTERRRVKPNVSKNKSNQWITVVNTEQNPQFIEIEICRNPDQSCNSDSIKTGYTSVCRQFFSYRKILAVNETHPYTDAIEIPSCCKCVITEMKK